jgi:predicted nuclease of restriction endonuclease-like RecB superfamily
VRANLRLVQSLLQRSAHVCLRLEGNARPVLRHAKWCGLICTVVADEPSQAVRLDISGPLTLFRRTLVYGRALAQLLPRLTWCNRFFLDAEVALADGPRRLILGTGAPIFPGEKPRPFDSKLEERFARDFLAATTEWNLVREPEPIPVGRGLIFPDFSLTRRSPPFERWLVEIVGFWTADYLERKLATYRLAGLERLILCIDEKRQCSHEDLPARAHVVRFAKRVDVRDVLGIIET